MDDQSNSQNPQDPQAPGPGSDFPPLPQTQKPTSTVFVAGQPQQTEVSGQAQPPRQTYEPEDYEGGRRGLGGALRGFLIFGVVALLLFFGIIFLVIPRLQSGSNQKVTLTYWGLWEDSNVVGSVIADFQRQYPNIEVNYVREDPNQYSQRLLTRIQNGTGPDIFRYHNTWIPMILPILTPLPNEVISKNDFIRFFYPVMQTDLIRGGALYGIPLEVDTLALFTNTALLGASGVQVPTSWNDFLTAARQLTVKDENGKIKTAGAALGTYDNITHAPDIVSLLFVQNGVNLRNISSTAKSAADALTFYTSFAKDEGNVWDNTLDPSLLAFSRGKLAMYFGYAWDIFTIKAQNPDLNFQVSPVPHLPGRSTTIASYWVEGVSQKSKHQKEAILFMHFLAQRETMQKLFAEEAKTRLFGELYPRVDLADSLQGNNLIYPFVLQAGDASSSFFAGETYDTGIDAQMNGYLGNAVRSILGNTSPDSAVMTLSQGMAQVLSQYEGIPQKQQ